MSRASTIENLRRAPVPEWEELARAAWPGKVPLAIAAWCGRANLTLLLMGLLAQFVAGWAHLPWLSLGAWVISSVADWLSTRADPPTSRLLDLTGIRPQVRALLRSLLAASAIFALPTPNAITAAMTYVSVVLFVQLSWFLQPTLATWVSRTAPALRFEPQSAKQPSATARHLRIYARGAGTPLVMVAIEFAALADATLAAFVPVGTNAALLGLTMSGALLETALIYLGWTAWQAHTARRDAVKMGRALVADLTTLAPVFMVYASFGPRRAGYLVNPWLPVFDELDLPGLVVVREAVQLAGLKPTRLPVIYAPSRHDVERLTLPSILAGFYLAQGERNADLQRDPRLRHILALLDLDQSGQATNLARGFDEIWVAGDVAVAAFAAAAPALAPDQLVVIGRPQATTLTVGPTGNKNPIILYAPSFEGEHGLNRHTSLDQMGARMVRRLLAKHPDVRVWFRPHPASGGWRPSMLTAITELGTILRHARGDHQVITEAELSLAECLAKADVLILDGWGPATDFLQTERPILACNPSGLPDEEFVALFPNLDGAYLVNREAASLDEGLDQALGADRLKPERVALKRRVLGAEPEAAQAAFAANVRRVTASPSSVV